MMFSTLHCPLNMSLYTNMHLFNTNNAMDYLDIVFTFYEIQAIYIHVTFTLANKYCMCVLHHRSSVSAAENDQKPFFSPAEAAVFEPVCVYLCAVDMHI